MWTFQNVKHEAPNHAFTQNMNGFYFLHQSYELIGIVPSNSKWILIGFKVLWMDYAKL
jgi:hypothetical protein